ncbi:MAG: UDP-N-acetylmuramoyl-L-alanyl-D-glutamate--2,6-diaminopimelate ligase [Candidatus Cloacimonetes bacterium]|nr:UDP-N-acetylmuramoyl-L-alanyl-D-glutamate--2,6-diaminopimelate ligase [Candidatus Cloacimonadota bacterium]
MILDLLNLYKQHKILVNSKIEGNISLASPVCDHRLIKPGNCFIAIKGENFNGHDYIAEVIQAGASYCIGETDETHITVTDSRKALALYAKLFYDNPSSKLTIFGVTGTNGKTTTSLVLHQILMQKGIKCAWIGTLGYKILDEDFPTAHTTPDILELNTILKQMLDYGITHVVMEVSSHALALDRVYSIHFDYCLFTNLSRDHLDFHRDMDEYFEAKYLLFERAAANSAISVINTDDEYGARILERIKEIGGKAISIGVKPDSDIWITSSKVNLAGSEFTLNSNLFESCHIESPLTGTFNVDNLALACAALYAYGINPIEFATLCQNLKPVKGRIESVSNNLGIGVYVDYAHSPDAITNVLKSMQQIPHGRIITVFGAGGNRDKGKRPLMLKAALSYSDAIIVTDDNPRFENPERIIYEIVKDSNWHLPWWIIRDRGKAIAAAIRLARKNDIVLICGKGHETYQEINGIRYDFSDQLVAISALENIPIDKTEEELILPVDKMLLNIIAGNEPDTSTYLEPKCYHYISTDSRNIKPKSVFFAIKGENYDGNNFVTEVLQKPETMAITANAAITNSRCIITENPELLLARCLHKYLQMFDIYKIALTGSTGKTSTKELIAQVFSAKQSILKTLKNENNLIGLCKTILRIEPKHQYGIFEMGTNHFGEIKLLSDTLMPDAGIILNIGPSHLEYFKDEDGVFNEKSELFHRALDLRLFPADDPRFDVYKEDGSSIGYAENADYRICGIEESETGISFYINEHHWQIPYKAPHYIINSAFAIVLAQKMGFSNLEIQSALKESVSLDMRMQILPRYDGYLIVDCYNANPVSMQSAIEFWHKWQPHLPHYAILGDMLELGESSDLYHKMIGAILSERSEQNIYSVGIYSLLYHANPDKHFASSAMLVAELPQFPPNAVILVKASHGIHLEKVLPHLKGEA